MFFSPGAMKGRNLGWGVNKMQIQRWPLIKLNVNVNVNINVNMNVNINVNMTLNINVNVIFSHQEQ